MKKNIIICRYGPAIAHAVALRFGREGYHVALIARDAQRLKQGISRLEAQGIHAQSFTADLGDVEQVKRAIAEIRTSLGTVSVLFWNAFADIEGNLLSTSVADLQQGLSVRVIGYITAVQEVVHDLQQNQGAVLATSGAMAICTPEADSFSCDFSAAAIAAAAQHKTTGMLVHTLTPLGVYVGEVVVNGFVIGSRGTEGYVTTINPTDVAEKYWQLNQQRLLHSVSIS